MTAGARRKRRAGAKTGRIDALEIARIAAREPDLRAPRCADPNQDTACLTGYRRELLDERTMALNRLHGDMEKLRSGYHTEITSLGSVKGLNQAARMLRDDKSARARVLRSRITWIRVLNRQVEDL